MALYISEQLIARGKVERGWLGVSVQDLTPELAKSFGAESTKGALIAEVVKGGPAEKAGMKQGDIIVSYQSKEITNASTLRNEVAISRIGEEAKATILRNGKTLELTVAIGNLEDATKLLSASVKERLGVEVRPATALEAEKYGLQPQQGVVIKWLDPKGPLGKVGFEVGDMILEINGQPIESVDDFVSVVSTVKPGQKIAVVALDHNSGNTGYVEVEVG
jgi:serine protease Do